MKPNYYISLLLLILPFVACNNQPSEEQPNNEHLIFSSQIDTKLDHEAFSTSDQIGLYIVERITPEIQNTEADDMINALAKNYLCTTGADGYLVMPNIVEYPEKNIDAHAYFPYDVSEASGEKGNIRNISVKSNQTEQADYFYSDFKKATYLNWSKPDSKATQEVKAIPLTFFHQFSKVILTFKSSTKSIEEVKALIKGVKFENVAVTGTFDMITNMTLPNLNEVESNNIIPFGTLEISNNTLIGIEAILIPCEANNSPLLVIEADGGNYTVTLAEKLLQGREYKFIVDINDGGKMSYTVNLAPWNDSESFGNME